MKRIKLEYHSIHIDTSNELEVTVPDNADVIIMDTLQVGGGVRWSYVVETPLTDNPDPWTVRNTISVPMYNNPTPPPPSPATAIGILREQDDRRTAAAAARYLTYDEVTPTPPEMITTPVVQGAFQRAVAAEFPGPIESRAYTAAMVEDGGLRAALERVAGRYEDGPFDVVGAQGEVQAQNVTLEEARRMSREEARRMDQPVADGVQFGWANAAESIHVPTIATRDDARLFEGPDLVEYQAEPDPTTQTEDPDHPDTHQP